MNYELFGNDVLFFQRLLKSDGFYVGKLDGLWGPLTESASNAFRSEYEALREELGEFDRRTEKHISTLSTRAQKEARHFMRRALSQGVNVKIISGTRTYEDQNKLYRQGRYGSPGRKITNARGGKSNHNFGIAWDIGIFNSDGSYSHNDLDYNSLALYAKELLEWGGDWRSFSDPPHYQLQTIQQNISWVRSRFESGEIYIA